MKEKESIPFEKTVGAPFGAERMVPCFGTETLAKGHHCMYEG